MGADQPDIFVDLGLLFIGYYHLRKTNIKIKVQNLIRRRGTVASIPSCGLL